MRGVCPVSPRAAVLQGEHGTGRNVAPYVEMEWGGKAYDLMWRLKSLFDPDDVLNPGVVLNKVLPTLYAKESMQRKSLFDVSFAVPDSC